MVAVCERAVVRTLRWRKAGLHVTCATNGITTCALKRVVSSTMTFLRARLALRNTVISRPQNEQLLR